MQNLELIYHKYISAFLLSLLAVLAPIQPLVIAMIVLVLFDLILGVSVAWKTGVPITSKGLRHSIIKIMVYLVAIISGFVCETYLLGGLLPITKILAAMIGISELKSVLENAEILTNNRLIVYLTDKLSPKSAKDLVDSIFPGTTVAQTASVTTVVTTPATPVVPEVQPIKPPEGE